MSTVKKSLSEASATSDDIKRIRAVEDKDIDYSDIPELDNDFWDNATISTPGRPKKQVTLRINADVLDWFKAQGKGYQTRINDVLRHFYEHHRHER